MKITEEMIPAIEYIDKSVKVDLTVEGFNELLVLAKEFNYTLAICGGKERLEYYKMMGLTNQREFVLMKQEKDKLKAWWEKHGPKKSKRKKKARNDNTEQDNSTTEE